MTVLVSVLALRLVATLVLAIPGAWTLMLLIGSIHHNLAPTLPAIGYGATYPIALLLGWSLTFLNFTDDTD